MTDDVTDPFVRVRGAAEHNLRDVDVDLPRNAFVAFTGVSGSGKSSLAFGTLYAEAQRRYFESVAPYARRLLQQVGARHCIERRQELPEEVQHPLFGKIRVVVFTNPLVSAIEVHLGATRQVHHAVAMA